MANPYDLIRPAIKKSGLQYPSDVASLPICFMINLRPYVAGDFAPDFVADYIYLPMPTSGLIDNYSIEYTEHEMGAIGGVAATMTDPSSWFGTGGVRALLSAGTMFAKSIGTSAAEALGDLVGQGDKATAGSDLLSGFINNPNYAILFKGLKPRKFSFDWTMIAKNQEEAQSIGNIIKTIKQHALPAKQFGANFALNYPSIAHLAVVGPNSTEMYITFAENGAFIENVSVNYSGAGHATFFKDSLPVQVNLRLDFQERSIITSDAIV